jgi:hypothetical protein
VVKASSLRGYVITKYNVDDHNKFGYWSGFQMVDDEPFKKPTGNGIQSSKTQ